MTYDANPIELVLDTRGGCMRPWVWPGGKLHVKRCRIDELRLGDVAIWFDGTELRSHRVVRLERDGFVTRGDLMDQDDPPAKPEQLVGKGSPQVTAG